MAHVRKGGDSRLFAETPTDNGDVIALEARSSSKVGVIHLHDIVLLSQHFNVSRMVAIYRLRNLQLISPTEMKRLLVQEREGRGRQLEKLLQFPDPDQAQEGNRFRQHFLNLALDVFDRELISRSKLEELFAVTLDVPKSEVQLELGSLIELENLIEVSIPA